MLYNTTPAGGSTAQLLSELHMQSDSLQARSHLLSQSVGAGRTGQMGHRQDRSHDEGDLKGWERH